MKILRFGLLVMVLHLIFYNTYMVAEQRNHQEKTTYIVHMDRSNMPESFNDHNQWYESSLKSVSHSANMLYTYNTVIHGFSTRLTTEEAKSLQGQPGILSVQAEVRYELHTTRTPTFLGLDKSDAFCPETNSVSEVIIGVLDTGVWPEIKSFDDTGLGPVPRSWKGKCEKGKNFKASSCNRKLIGARFFSKGYEASMGPTDETIESKSPRDDDGHGTHTSTTAAGSSVTGASLFGYAAGTARGMASRARVAAYKVCWAGGCFAADILAAMDKAVQDGVNIISISIGGGSTYYDIDSVAIGAFKAMEHGVFVSCSAGNGGPSSGSLSNVAPWITTVGAGTLDRSFPAQVRLGNGKNFSGVSLYSGKPLPGSLLPLVFAGNASNSPDGNFCASDSLNPREVSGKIVVCDRGGGSSRTEKGAVVKHAGGAGLILTNTQPHREDVLADAQLLPAVAMSDKSGNLIKNYIFSDPNPRATISFERTRLGIQPSPVVAAFSSRGPNLITLEILKPDLIAPGVNILAGWTGAVGPTGLEVDTRRVNFNIVSGTSMSCPHVSGLAALLKAAHPEWSPAAIKSALMTTAYNTYKNGKIIQDAATGKPSTPFDYGAGHVNPVAALDPGLVYDTTIDDYLSFLCALQYNPGQIKWITNKDFTCKSTTTYKVGDLNYPSFVVPLKAASSKGRGRNRSVSSKVSYKRTLTNVGIPATYKVSVSSQTKSVKILVEPKTLSFSKLYEKKSYTVTFLASSKQSGQTSFARLQWSDGKHIVGSPVVFIWK